VDCHPRHRRLPELIETADVLILATLDWDLFPLFEQRRAAGRITILEANDWYFDIQPWNPKSIRWLDRSLQDTFRHCLRLVDGVQTSTPELARRWREMTSRPVAVFPNQLPDVPPRQPTIDRPFTVGWGGSRGHLADWFQLAPALQTWLDHHPAVHLAVMTDDHAKEFLRLPPERYHFQPLGTLDDYCEFLGRLDVGLAPLLPTEFNRCRSDVKFLEYASRGVVGIYSDLEPYRHAVEHGRTGYLYRTPRELFEFLDLLLADATLRDRLRQQAYDQVTQQRRLEDHIDDRLTFYLGLLAECRSAAKGLPQTTRSNPPTTREFATPPINLPGIPHGGYVQLAPEEAEQVLDSASDAKPSSDSVRALTQLLDQYPDYVAALRQLGRTHNELRQPNAAVPYLTRAREMAPLSTEVVCELARAHFLQGQVAQAQSLLEQALELNPYYSLPWRYWLRLLSRAERDDNTPNARELAARLRKWQPSNYGLALMALRLYPAQEAMHDLQLCLDDYVPGLHACELPTANAAFSEALAVILGPCLDDPKALNLLGRAADALPQSARLADLLARALALAGQTSASYSESARAERLRRAALCYRAEFPQDESNSPNRSIAAQLADELSGLDLY